MTNETVPLKRVKVKATQIAPGSDGIPVVPIEGDLIAAYNEADKKEKDGKKEKDALRDDIVAIAVEDIFERSCKDPAKPTLTVKLTDEEGQSLRVEFADKYGPVDPKQVVRLFAGKVLPDGAKANVNDYVHEVVVVKFDSKVFLDKEGKFSQRKYDKYLMAVSDVALEEGDPCPLDSSKTVVAKDTFHADRWRDFPSVKMQADIFGVLENSIRVVPITVKPDKKADKNSFLPR